MKSFQDLVCPDHHKVTMGHHLVLRSPKQSKQAKSLSRVRLFATPWAVAYQAPPSMGFFQVRMLEWVAISFSKGSSQTRDQTQVSRIAGRPFTLWATREAQGISKALGTTYYLHCAWSLSLQKGRKSQPIIKISNSKDNPGDLPGMEGGFMNSSPPHLYWP